MAYQSDLYAEIDEFESKVPGILREGLLLRPKDASKASDSAHSSDEEDQPRSLGWKSIRTREAGHFVPITPEMRKELDLIKMEEKLAMDAAAAKAKILGKDRRKIDASTNQSRNHRRGSFIRSLESQLPPSCTRDSPKYMHPIGS